MTWDEACRTLKIQPTASPVEIHDQYIYLANLLHPDKTGNLSEKLRKQAEEELKLVNQAYDFLKNPQNNPYKTSPKLEITPNHIRFKEVEIGQKKTTSFRIKSVGGTYTKIWIDDAPSQWLHVTNLKSLTNEELPLEVTIEATGIDQSGVLCECNLQVRLENEETKSKDEVMVKIQLALKAEPPILGVDTNVIEVNFAQSGQPKIRTFELTNIGLGVLRANINTTRRWLSVSPNIAAIGPSVKSTHIITIKSDSLSYGFSDTEFISINTNGGNATIRVNLSIGPPLTYKERLKERLCAFSFKKFGSTLFWMLILPLLPPFLFITPYIFSRYLHGSLFYIAVGTYVAAAIVLSCNEGMQEGRKKAAITAPLSKPTSTTPSTQPIAFVVGNRFSLAYHKPWCMWAKRISSYNRVDLTVEEAKKQGYKCCKVCRPWD
jgi:hypothetical protein